MKCLITFHSSKVGRSLLISLFFVVGVFGSSAQVYVASLSGPNESPANGSPGKGYATVTIDNVANTMRVQTTFSGLTGTTTASHIHAATAVPGVGTAGVATTTPSFVGFPLGVTSGSMDQTYNMLLTSSYNPAYITANGGTAASAFAALKAAIAAGKSYLNIHTSTFGGGEIRGFLVPQPLIYAATDEPSPRLVSFNPSTPNVFLSNVQISGILPGHTLRGIDFRPATGRLYALSNVGTTEAAQLYIIDLSTAVATPVGAGVTLVGNTSLRISIDFNPVVDRIRVVTGNAKNYRVDPNTGALTATDTDINPPFTIADVAYTNNFLGATTTTLYAYDFGNDNIGTIGSINGTPASPNGGQFFNVGPSGVTSFSAALGMDVVTDQTTGVNNSYLSMDDAVSASNNSEFYSVNLATGGLTFIGGFSTPILDIAIVPRPPVTWYVDDNSNTGDVFTPVGTGDDANPGTAALPFATIGKAVSVAFNGDIILVDAGSYSEQVRVTKSLKIYGPNNATSPVNALGSRTTEATITAVSTPQAVSAAIFLAPTLGTTVEIKGFKFLNGSPLTDAHEPRGGSTNDINIIFEKNWVDHGFHVSAGSFTKWKNVTVTDNYFTNLDKVPTSCAVQLYDASGPATVNMTVTDNKIETTNWRGISIGNALTANISRNQISTCPDAGIMLELAMGNTTVSQNVINLANTSLTVDLGGITMYGSQFTGTVNITNNQVTSSWNGFSVRLGEAITNPNIHVNNNSFDGTNLFTSMFHGGNNVGVNGGGNGPASPNTMDGECNWHGFSDPLVVAGRKQGPIDYVFFLPSGTDAAPGTIGFQPAVACTGGPIQPPPVDPGDDHVKIFPAPVTSMMKVQYSSVAQKKVEIIIVDQSGRIIRTENTVVMKGLNEMQFDVHLLVKGIYTVIVKDGVKQSHQKMIKM